MADYYLQDGPNGQKIAQSGALRDSLLKNRVTFVYASLILAPAKMTIPCGQN